MSVTVECYDSMREHGEAGGKRDEGRDKRGERERGESHGDAITADSHSPSLALGPGRIEDRLRCTRARLELSSRACERETRTRG